jgi:hypothetical protein
MPPQKFTKHHVIRHGESTNRRTNGGKLNRSVWFSDKVPVQFVPGLTNRMVFEMFYTAVELTKFRDDAVIEESGLLESVSASAEPTFKVEFPAELVPSPKGGGINARKGRISRVRPRQSLLLQVAESPIAIRARSSCGVC